MRPHAHAFSPTIVLILAALAAPGAASADDAVAELTRDTPVAAYGGAVAWSAYDAASQRYALVIRQGDTTAPAPIRTARTAFDVSLGPDARGRVVALYTRCRTATRGCDVYRYDLRARREGKVAAVSSPSFDEAWPAQWGGQITFARRARAHLVDGYDHRPDPRGRGPVLDCDIPYVRALTPGARSRRLDRSQCGATTGMAIRGSTIVQVTDINQGGAGSESQVRRLRTRGGAARILARTGGGEGGYSPFRAPSLSDSAVWLTRAGRREGVVPGFLRIDLRSARLTTVPAQTAGRIARDEHGTFWYIQAGPPDFDGDQSCALVLEPCRLVRASASPFSSTPRRLLARLTIAGAPTQVITAFAADPQVLTGELTRAIVRGGTVIGSDPVPGAGLTLLRTDDQSEPGPFTPTGLTATTDLAGRWSFTVPGTSPRAVLVVVAPGLRIATEVVEITFSSRISLGASGGVLTGSVAPAQPGRTVDIERLTADARGRLPNGQEVCPTPPTPQNCSDAAWTVVAHAPLDAAGSTFSVPAGAPGSYRARLSYAVDARGRPTAYGGVSPAAQVSTP
jgi:hypothetical protein